MDDDLDANSCDICFLAYNNSNHLPKIIECCSHTFCLECLKLIYAKNNNKLMCSICRKFTDKNPINLNTNLSKFASQKPKCLQCKKETELDRLFVKIIEMKDFSNFIFCNKCLESQQYNNNNNDNVAINNKFSCNNNLNKSIGGGKITNNSENLSLKDFLETLKIELNFILKGNLKTLESFNAGNNNTNQNRNSNSNRKAEEALDIKIMNLVDVYFEKFKRNIKVKIKQFMNTFLLNEFAFNFEMEREINSFNSDLIKKISTLITEVNAISQINDSNISKINKAIFFYLQLNNMDFMIQRLLLVKSFISNLGFNFSIANNDNFEDLIVNNLELKQNNELFFSNAENYEIKNFTKEFVSGIKLIDNEFLKLKKSINNYVECFSDYGVLTQKNEELVKELSEQENKYKTLANNFTTILNENVELSEANKKLEQQIGDFLVKNQTNNKTNKKTDERVRELEEKLKESQVLLSEQSFFVQEIRSQLETCCIELEKTRKENIIMQKENTSRKVKDDNYYDQKCNCKFNNNECEKVKFNKSLVIDELNFINMKLFKVDKNSSNYNNIFKDINCSVNVNTVFDENQIIDGRTSKLHKPNFPPGEVNNACFDRMTLKDIKVNLTPNTIVDDKDDFYLFGNG